MRLTNLGPGAHVMLLYDNDQTRNETTAQYINEGINAVVVADCAEKLSRNEKFEECGNVEKWWDGTCGRRVENGQRSRSYARTCALCWIITNSIG